MTNAATAVSCDDCTFRAQRLCALTDGPCPTFRRHVDPTSHDDEGAAVRQPPVEVAALAAE